jgi:hypothetical protein
MGFLWSDFVDGRRPEESQSDLNISNLNYAIQNKVQNLVKILAVYF